MPKYKSYTLSTIHAARADPPSTLLYVEPIEPACPHPRADLSPAAGDYCDVYLTHDSMSVRKAHNSGRNHLRNVVDYYQRQSLGTGSTTRLVGCLTDALFSCDRNRPRKGSERDRFHHILLCGRRPSRLESHAPTESAPADGRAWRIRSATTIRLPAIWCGSSWPHGPALPRWS